MKKYLLVFLLLALPACSVLEAEEAANVTLVNRTNETVYYLAVDAETATLIDLIPDFSPENPPFPAIQPEQSRLVQDIEGYSQGEDIVFFFYAIREVIREGVKIDRGVMVKMLDVTDEELSRNNGRVFLESLRNDGSDSQDS